MGQFQTLRRQPWNQLTIKLRLCRNIATNLSFAPSSAKSSPNLSIIRVSFFDSNNTKIELDFTPDGANFNLVALLWRNLSLIVR